MRNGKALWRLRGNFATIQTDGRACRDSAPRCAGPCHAERAPLFRICVRVYA